MQYRSVGRGGARAGLLAAALVACGLLGACREDDGEDGDASRADPIAAGELADAGHDAGASPAADASREGAVEVADAGAAATEGQIAECIEAASERGQTGACVECGCRSCHEAVSQCQDEACQRVVSCGLEHGCEGSDCYCGVGVALDACVGRAMGPCMEEIVEASGKLGVEPTCSAVEQCALSLANLQYAEPDNAVERARRVSLCTQGQTESDGVPGFVLPLQEIVGHCEDECG